MLLFFYGTLVAGNDHALARAVHERLRPLGAATTRGMLHAIADPAGWYPALTPGNGVVHGQLYATLPAFSADDLAALDAFENCDPGRPELSDYVRHEIAVTDAGDRRRRAQAYVWRLPVPADARELADGDFAGWLARTRLPAYR